MPSHTGDGGKGSARKSLFYAILLTVLVLSPIFSAFGQPQPGLSYLLSAIPLSLYIVWASAKFLWAENRDLAARKLFYATIIYLPILFVALAVDRHI